MAGKKSQDEFVVWQPRHDDGTCRLSRLEGFDRDNLFRRGVPLADRWPADVKYAMDPFEPDNIVLSDALRTLHPVAAVSARLAAFLQKRLGSRVECLPIAVVNHKKRKVPEPYFLAQPLGPIDALDADASKAKRSTIVPTAIDSVRKLVLRAQDVPVDALMFRLANYMEPILVRRTFADELEDEGFTGIGWQSPAEHRTA